MWRRTPGPRPATRCQQRQVGEAHGIALAAALGHHVRQAEQRDEQQVASRIGHWNVMPVNPPRVEWAGDWAARPRWTRRPGARGGNVSVGSSGSSVPTISSSSAGVQEVAVNGPRWARGGARTARAARVAGVDRSAARRSRGPRTSRCPRRAAPPHAGRAVAPPPPRGGRASRAQRLAQPSATRKSEMTSTMRMGDGRVRRLVSTRRRGQSALRRWRGSPHRGLERAARECVSTGARRNDAQRLARRTAPARHGCRLAEQLAAAAATSDGGSRLRPRAVPQSTDGADVDDQPASSAALGVRLAHVRLVRSGRCAASRCAARRRPAGTRGPRELDAGVRPGASARRRGRARADAATVQRMRRSRGPAWRIGRSGGMQLAVSESSRGAGWRGQDAYRRARSAACRRRRCPRSASTSRWRSTSAPGLRRPWRSIAATAHEGERPRRQRPG